MGKGDHCAVYGCNNDRRYPERYLRSFIVKFSFYTRSQRVIALGK